jgi:hypothetical protein
LKRIVGDFFRALDDIFIPEDTRLFADSKVPLFLLKSPFCILKFFKNCLLKIILKVLAFYGYANTKEEIEEIRFTLFFYNFMLGLIIAYYIILYFF